MEEINRGWRFKKGNINETNTNIDDINILPLVDQILP